jgi:hypothetical protein
MGKRIRGMIRSLDGCTEDVHGRWRKALFSLGVRLELRQRRRRPALRGARVMIRSILLVLLPLLAGCAYTGPPVTWVETVYEPPPRTVYGKIFFIDRQWNVGDCILGPGSHVTLSKGRPSANVGLGLSTRSGQAARWRYGITFLAADGTMLAHYPHPDGRVFLQRIHARARDFIGGTSFYITDDVYERVTRVLIHARC